MRAKFAAPVWSFDRIVIPAGTVAVGRLDLLLPVPRMVRATAMMGGNFTPLKIAEVSFSKLILPGGKTIAVQTRDSPGLVGIYAPPKASKRKHRAQRTNPNGKTAELRRLAHQQVNAQLNARTRGLWDFVRGRNRREWLEDFLLDKLPYRPQWYRKGTLFNSVLSRPLDLGTISVARHYLSGIGSEPAPNSVADVRILSTLSSATARVGDPLDGVLSAPVFGANHRLILPEGTKVTGKVTFAQHARFFHRGGKLRFVIEGIEPPDLASLPLEPASDPPPKPVLAQLVAVQADPKKLKVDEEGGVHTTASKTRLLRPVVAALVAAKSLDNDTGKQGAYGGASASPNAAGLALGGFSGFGTFGLAAAHAPIGLGTALGFYGLGLSVYSNVVARGSEVVFPKNTEIAIRFGAPPPKNTQLQPVPR